MYYQDTLICNPCDAPPVIDPSTQQECDDINELCAQGEAAYYNPTTNDVSCYVVGQQPAGYELCPTGEVSGDCEWVDIGADLGLTEARLVADVFDDTQCIVRTDACVLVLGYEELGDYHVVCTTDEQCPSGSGVGEAEEGGARTITSSDSPYTPVATDQTIIIDATSGNVTVDLPTAGSGKREFWFKRKDSSANTVTIDGDGSETIDGATTKTLASQYDKLHIHSDLTEWWDLT